MKTIVLKRYVLSLTIISAISAFTFILVVHRHVFDEQVLMQDVSRYVTEGTSVRTLRKHTNAPGPTAFLLMAQVIRIFDHNELVDARFVALISWMISSGTILLRASASRTPIVWYFAIFAALTFPHSMTAMATVLTEGPSLLFAVLGSFLWIESLSSGRSGYRSTLMCLSGGLLMGTAATVRQYYVALIPAMVFFALFSTRLIPSYLTRKRVAMICASVSLAALPIILLALVWNGLSSPGMPVHDVQGRALIKVGVSIQRPLIAAFYTALYLLPLTFTTIRQGCRGRVLVMVVVSLLFGLMILPFQSALAQPGPLDTLLTGVGKIYSPAKPVLTVAMVLITVLNLLSVSRLFWRRRTLLFREPEVLFSLSFIIIFIAEQIGISGNPFYDRYVLQVIPFVGIMASFLISSVSFKRLSLALLLYLLSQSMLWRYAFTKG